MFPDNISRKKFLKLMGSSFAIFAIYQAGLLSPLLSSLLKNENRVTNVTKAMNGYGNYFQVGVNMHRWEDMRHYGQDLGYNQFSGDSLWHWPYTDDIPSDISKPNPNPPEPYLSANPEKVEEFFRTIEGLDIVRIWLFENLEGLVFDGNQNSKLVGLDSELLKNLKKILDTAGRYNVKVYITLLNGIDTRYSLPEDFPTERSSDYFDWRNAQRLIFRSIVRNPDSFLDLVLIPLVTEIKNYSSLYAIDLVNEPEFMMADDNEDPIVTDTEMVSFIEKCTMAVKRVSSNQIQVSIGCEDIDTAKRYSALPIDFVDIHKYIAIHDQGIEVYKAEEYSGKPCIIGECGLLDADLDETTIKSMEVSKTKEIVIDAKSKGYIGALVWGLFDEYIRSQRNKEELMQWLKEFRNGV
jgi:hypothetical protein